MISSLKANEDFVKKYAKKFPPESIIIKEDDVGRTMFIIQSGKVAVAKNSAQGERVLATLGEGEFFGEMALLGMQERRSATVRSVSETQVLELSRDAFDAIIKRSPQVALHMIETLALRLREANHKISALGQNTEAAKICAFLESLCREESFKVPPPDSGMLIKATPQRVAQSLQIPQPLVDKFFTIANKAQLLGVQGPWTWVPHPNYLESLAVFISKNKLL